MTAKTYRVDPASTPGTDESGAQGASSGGIVGVTNAGNEPATLTTTAVGSGVVITLNKE